MGADGEWLDLKTLTSNYCMPFKGISKHRLIPSRGRHHFLWRAKHFDLNSALMAKSAIKKPSPIFKMLIFLGDKYDSIGSLQWRSSGSDSLPLCFGHFPTSYMKIKINCMKNSLKFSKTVWCNTFKKTNFMFTIIHHHVPIHINRHIVK